MNAYFRLVPLVAALLLFGTGTGHGAATITQQIDPPEVTLGDQVTVTITIQNGEGANLQLPQVDGLQVTGTGTATRITLNNGAFSSSIEKTFQLLPSRAGDFTIPAFDISLQDGGTLHAQAMKLHVTDPGTAPANNAPTTAPATAPATANVPAIPTFNPNGPVVMPPAHVVGPTPPDANTTTTDDTTSNVNVPLETDGRPAKVFIVITPQTTDAYVGESIPMRIDFYLRMDVAAQQDSLPTIKGSDFLMNNLSGRPGEDQPTIMNELYLRETWVTAISAPKSGDFPLQMVRDTYWVKRARNNFSPFGNIFISQPNLAHEPIGSNQLTVHVHPLPDENRPTHFTGAIGQLTVTGSADPLTVAVGEPVTLTFTVTGSGNFDYVRCPVLADDPAWKTYVASSKIEYHDQSRTQGEKTFVQAVIPKKNGTLSLPPATFSYFDPNAKQYVTVPISLPAITVTGSAAAPTPLPGATSDSSSTPVPPGAPEFLPNRLTFGALTPSLTPVYRQTWFWAAQGGMALAVGLALLVALLASRTKPVDDAAARLQQKLSLQEAEAAMTEAVRQNDALAFFVAARHSVQLRLGAQWHLNPESLTLGEIRERDPQLAETLQPLFTQADEVIYSGGTGGRFDLAHWERHVRQLLQPQLQPA